MLAAPPWTLGAIPEPPVSESGEARVVVAAEEAPSQKTEDFGPDVAPPCGPSCEVCDSLAKVLARIF